MADLVSKTIVISLGNGSLQAGFSTVTARFLTSNNALLEQVQGGLPAAPDIVALYKRWQTLYHGLSSRFVVSGERQSFFRSLEISDDELEIDEAGVTHRSIDCNR